MTLELQQPIKRKQTREEKLAYYKEYRQRNKERISQQRRGHYQQNKERISQQRREYHQRNKGRICQQKREYRQQNKEKIRRRKIEHWQQNRERECQRQKEKYQRIRHKRVKTNRPYISDLEMQKIRPTLKEFIKNIRGNGIRSGREYTRLYKERKLPKGFPYHPESFYNRRKI